MTIATSLPLCSIHSWQRALGHLKVCAHWAGTNRLPAALLVGLCVSRAQVRVISGQTAAVSFCGHVSCRYPRRDSSPSPAVQQQAVFTSAKFVPPGPKYKSDWALLWPQLKLGSRSREDVRSHLKGDVHEAGSHYLSFSCRASELPWAELWDLVATGLKGITVRPARFSWFIDTYLGITEAGILRFSKNPATGTNPVSDRRT